MSAVKGTHVKNRTTARLAALSSATAALAIGGASLPASAAAILAGDHGSHNHTVGEENLVESNYSPTKIRGAQNVETTSSGGQNSGLKVLCPKAPCRISQTVNRLRGTRWAPGSRRDR